MASLAGRQHAAAWPSFLTAAAWLALPKWAFSPASPSRRCESAPAARGSASRVSRVLVLCIACCPLLPHRSVDCSLLESASARAHRAPRLPSAMNHRRVASPFAHGGRLAIRGKGARRAGAAIYSPKDDSHSRLLWLVLLASSPLAAQQQQQASALRLCSSVSRQSPSGHSLPRLSGCESGPSRGRPPWARPMPRPAAGTNTSSWPRSR